MVGFGNIGQPQRRRKINGIFCLRQRDDERRRWRVRQLAAAHRLHPLNRGRLELTSNRKATSRSGLGRKYHGKSMHRLQTDPLHQEMVSRLFVVLAVGDAPAFGCAETKDGG